MTPLLKEGDIIELKKGHRVYVTLPHHFLFLNAFGNFEDRSSMDVTIGETRNGLDLSFLEGRYVVVATSHSGGGTGMGEHDVYPDGHHVICQRLMPVCIMDFSARSMSRDKPLRVAFYQTGCFTAMIRDIEPVGRAVAEWHEPQQSAASQPSKEK